MVDFQPDLQCVKATSFLIKNISICQSPVRDIHLPSILCIALWQWRGHHPGFSARNRTIAKPCAGSRIVFFIIGRSNAVLCKMRLSSHSWTVQTSLIHFTFRFIDRIEPFRCVSGKPNKQLVNEKQVARTNPYQGETCHVRGDVQCGRSTWGGDDLLVGFLLQQIVFQLYRPLSLLVFGYKLCRVYNIIWRPFLH